MVFVLLFNVMKMALSEDPQLALVFLFSIFEFLDGEAILEGNWVLEWFDKEKYFSELLFFEKFEGIPIAHFIQSDR